MADDNQLARERLGFGMMFWPHFDALAQAAEHGASAIGLPTTGIDAAAGLPSADEVAAAHRQAIATELAKGVHPGLSGAFAAGVLSAPFGAAWGLSTLASPDAPAHPMLRAPDGDAAMLRRAKAMGDWLVSQTPFASRPATPPPATK